MTKLIDDMTAVLFAGCGGSSIGMAEACGTPVTVAINHNPVAIAVHEDNSPGTLHLVTDVRSPESAPLRLVGKRCVSDLWASPDCTDHSNAKGGVPNREAGKDTRSLAWVVLDWARLPVRQRPRRIYLENVPEFQKWGPLVEVNGKWQRDPDRIAETFYQFVGSLELLGYAVEWRVLTSCDYGAPTKRKRLYMVARCDGLPIVWPAATHGPGLLPFHTAAECIDWTLPCPSIFGRRKPLAEKTHARIAGGIVRHVLNNPKPYVVPVNGFLVAPVLIQTGYGERKGQRPRYLDINEPLGTVMADGQKHGLVAVFLAKHFKGVFGHGVDRPFSTITAKDHHAVVAASLQPGGHAPKVHAFLTAYYGSGQDFGQALDEPMRTVVTKDRFGLVVVEGAPHGISDIGMRMVAPHELLRAQFGRYAADFDLSAAKTTKDKVHLVGNSVCPEVAEALVRANFHNSQRRAA